MAVTWQIFTPEYPPIIGGISDYTLQVATGLRAEGDEVHVWCPPSGETEDARPAWVHPQRFWLNFKAIRRLDRELNRFPGPRRILVQWLPHGYGYNSMNVPFCMWLWSRSRRGDIVEIMLHEAFLWFRQGSWRQDVVAVLHRVMTAILLQAAHRVWMSTPAWEPLWRPYSAGRKIPFAWLPVPSNIPVTARPEDVRELRRKFAKPGQTILGHFGTFGRLTTTPLEKVIPPLLENRPDRILLLIGRDGERFRQELVARHPRLEGQIVSVGSLNAADLSTHLAACDLMLQPYPDGITTRRTSAMAGLAHGVPTLTTNGYLTEQVWEGSGAVALAQVGNYNQFVATAERLLADPDDLQQLGVRGRALYFERFDAKLVISALRGTTDPRPRLVQV